MEKKCKHCLTVKPLTDFHKSKHQEKKVSDQCKPCRKELSAIKYKENLFKSLHILKRSYCKSRSIPYDLDEDYLRGLWTGVCPIFKVTLVSHDRSNSNQYALDRKDPSKGYVKGNVEFICARANRIKYDATTIELESILNHMKGYKND